MDCGLTIDPTAVQAALNACLAVLERPDSAANFLIGLLVAVVVALNLIGAFALLRNAGRSR